MSQITDSQRSELFSQVMRECKLGNDYELPVLLNLTAAVVVVGSLQLALRHPANTGSSSRVVRSVIDKIIARLTDDGFPGFAMLAKLGDDPQSDGMDLSGLGEG